jgi:hypothetical protein
MEGTSIDKLCQVKGNMEDTACRKDEYEGRITTNEIHFHLKTEKTSTRGLKFL